MAPSAQGSIDPMVWQLQNELNMVRGEVMGWKQQQEMVQNQQLLNEINEFSGKAEYFEDARPTMVQLLQSGLAETLEEAYEKAIDAGYTADDYAFEDNLYEAIENPSIPYKVTLIKKGE